MFSLFDGPINIPGEKHGIKVEFMLLANIIAKPIMDMVGSFDKITEEKFNFMVTMASISTSIGLLFCLEFH